VVQYQFHTIKAIFSIIKLLALELHNSAFDSFWVQQQGVESSLLKRMEIVFTWTVLDFAVLSSSISKDMEFSFLIIKSLVCDQ
jgi:hypothetical protein